MYSINDEVKVNSNNDNENYDEFRNKILIITNVARNKNQHPGYDSSMRGMKLMDFIVKDTGEEVPFSLYSYEIEPA